MKQFDKESLNVPIPLLNSRFITNCVLPLLSKERLWCRFTLSKLSKKCSLLVFESSKFLSPTKTQYYHAFRQAMLRHMKDLLYHTFYCGYSNNNHL